MADTASATIYAQVKLCIAPGVHKVYHFHIEDGKTIVSENG